MDMGPSFFNKAGLAPWQNEFHDLGKRERHDDTLFHLIPTDLCTQRACFRHPRNDRFVSYADPTGNLGLEVGFHVRSTGFERFGGRVITTVGESGDLVLPYSLIDPVAISFEIHPETKQLILHICTQDEAHVRVVAPPDSSELMFSSGFGISNYRQMFLTWGEPYRISIGCRSDKDVFNFIVHWPVYRTKMPLDKHPEMYVADVKKLRNQALKWLPKEMDEPIGRGNGAGTGVKKTGKDPLRHSTREQVSTMGMTVEIKYSGKIGPETLSTRSVQFALETTAGHRPIAVKSLSPRTKADWAKLREVALLTEKLDHPHIIEQFELGDVEYIVGKLRERNMGLEVYMPFMRGSLADLAPLSAVASSPTYPNWDRFVLDTMLHQCLSALVYLSDQGLVHGNIKPSNILWKPVQAKGGNMHNVTPRSRPHNYIFQLSDFGMSQAFMDTQPNRRYRLHNAPEIWRQTDTPSSASGSPGSSSSAPPPASTRGTRSGRVIPARASPPKRTSSSGQRGKLTPKSDVWSLAVSILAVTVEGGRYTCGREFAALDPESLDLDGGLFAVRRAVLVGGSLLGDLTPMTHAPPVMRASAKEMLERLYTRKRGSEADPFVIGSDDST